MKRTTSINFGKIKSDLQAKAEEKILAELKSEGNKKIKKENSQKLWILNFMLKAFVHVHPYFFDGKEIFHVFSLKQNLNSKFSKGLISSYEILKAMRDAEGATDPMEIVVDDFVRCVFKRLKRIKRTFDFGVFSQVKVNVVEFQRFVEKDALESGESYWSFDGKTYDEIKAEADALYKRLHAPVVYEPFPGQVEIIELAPPRKV